MPSLGLTLSLRGNLLNSGSAFDPTTLFTGTDTGWVYDLSDMSTLFQDAAGTTPVTAVGQPVGLALDKSQGLVLGPELVTNGDFSNGTTGWTVPVGWSITGGAAVATAASGSLRGGGVTPILGRGYQVEFDVVSYTSGILYITVGGNFTGQVSLTGSGMSPGRKSIFVLSGSDAARGVEFYGGAVSATIDNISVRELPGNHRTQSTALNRPTYARHPLGGIRNLLTWTEDFTVSPWAATVVGTSTRTNTTSPYAFGLGLITATSANGGIRQQRTGLASGQPHTLSFYVESTTPTISVVFENGTANYGAVHAATINPSTGVFSGVSGFTSTSSVVFGTGRIYTLVTANAGGALIANIEIRIATSGGTMLFGRPQFETGSTATAYQRVGENAFDVTEAGVEDLYYLSYDGINDSLATASFAWGTDKATVVAGVRKLSDAAHGVVVGTFNTGIAGLFELSAPRLAGQLYGWVSYGTLAAVVASVSGYTAPITNVLTGLGDISGDRSTLRINGTQAAQSAADQGTGNFLTYPVYFGARAGTSLFFNGREYSNVGINRLLTTGELAALESWTAGKTGIAL